ncbi:MAG: hypothetical protein EP322_04160 [Bacteroidetes bacterium]|nr:MAG: hypothetical protein EP322_04160 [Bacteroidota bacterium]
MMKSLLLAFILVLFPLVLTAQQKEDIIQQRIEFISEQLEDESVDLTDVVVQLNYYYDHPLNLNSADRDELEALGLLTDIQISDLLLHIKLFGKFISIYELQSLTYWDLETIFMVLPFVRVDDKLDQVHVSLKEMLKYGKFEAFMRYQRIVEDKAGYEQVSDSILQNSNSYYYGNADRYYSRLRFSYRTNFSVGVTAEKDPGEMFFRGAQSQGFDFYSAHAFYKGGKYIQAVAIGDYQIQIGQGLNLWSGYAFNKTADATNVKRSAQPIRPYTSVDETRFLRGAAVDLGLGDFSLLIFGSYKGVDATLTASDTLAAEDFEASSINLSGLHRTNSEIDRKDALKEIIGGANFRFQRSAFNAGISAVYQGYDRPFIRDTMPYNMYDFRGKSTVGLSADYSWTYRNFNFFGEVANVTHSSAFANVHGVLIALDKFVSMSLVYRNYDRAYSTFYNAGFREGSRTQNEKGLYAGLKAQLTKSFFVSGYLDAFKFPWLRYQTDAPSDGHELLIQPTYRPNRNLEIYVRYREQQKARNSRDQDNTITEIEDVRQRNYRINFSYKVSDAFQIKSRIEYVTLERPSSEDEKGMIFTQDILFKPKSSPVDIALRYALFDTDSYDTRIYSYENNALYVFAVPAYYYRGSRAYVLLRYTFLRKCDLWFRYAVNIYANRDSLGSGAEEITGNKRSEITLQLRIKL